MQDKKVRWLWALLTTRVPGIELWSSGIRSPLPGEIGVCLPTPVIPVYFYGRRFLVQPYVKGFVPNQRAVNPSRYLSIQR